MRKMYKVLGAFENYVSILLGFKDKLGSIGLNLIRRDLWETKGSRAISCVPFVVVIVLLTSQYCYSQDTSMDAYIQYKIDFKQQEMEFVQHLRESQPGITKAQIKEELRQYYRENFDPPPSGESIEKGSGTSKELRLKTTAPTTSIASSTPFNQVPDALEYQVLRDLFESTGGERWLESGGWDYPNWKDTSLVSYLDFENWFGITVSNGDITKIWLDGNRLSGNLPHGIVHLKQLTHLNLSRCNFKGDSLPPELGQLQQLKQLYLFGSRFSGSLPTELGQLNQLEYMNLSVNAFSGSLPNELGELLQLNHLDLWFNDLSDSLPSELGQLGQLNYLDLNNNNFSGSLPSQLGQLQELNHLNLQRNNFSGTFPSELGQLRRLNYLDLSDNNFSDSLPSQLGQLLQLGYLSLWKNNFSGSIPTELGSLIQLTVLNLNENNFSGILPHELGQLQQLTHLVLSDNNLSGSIPPELGQLQQLTNLILSNNNFSGSLPTELGQLRQLGSLNIEDNNFSGSLPTELSQLQQLHSLNLSKNNFSGPVASFFVDFPELVVLRLNDNNFISFPNFSAVAIQRGMLTVNIAENKITWEHIEPNIQNGMNFIARSFEFAPQTLSEDTLVFLEIGSVGHISVSTGGVRNIYQWEKLLPDSVWQTLEGQTSDELRISNVALSDTGSYRLAVYNELAGGLSGPAFYSGIITVQIMEKPSPPLVSDNNICSNQAALLAATGSGTIQWYTDSTGGTFFHTGSTYTTPLLTETTTYYVSQTISGAESDRVPISAIVGPVFTISQDESLCLGESVPIVIDGDNLIVDWGSEIGALNSFVAQPDTTTTYSYTIEDAFGCTASGQVTITVNDPVDAEILPTVPVCPGQTATLEAVEVTGATYAWKPGGLSGRTVDVVINELQEYTLTVTSANGCSAQASILPEIQTIAVASEDREICEVDTVTLVAEGGDSYVWSTGDTIPEINFSRTIPGIYTLTVTATKDGCSASDDVVVTVNAFCPGTPISFMARAISTAEIELNWQEPPGNHTEYVIQRRNAAAVYETVTTLPVGTTAWPDSGLQPGTVYFYRIYSQVDTAQSEMRFARARTFTPNQNYVMETEVLTEGITDVAFVPNLNYHQRNSTWNYLNGLGSDMQTVVEGASPSEKDVVQPIIYDEYGMRSKQYLSYTIAQTTRPGNFRDSARKETTNFYADPPDGVANTSFPYAETVFDTSPQNKVLEQGSTGEAWQVSTGNTIKIDRTTNAASDVLHWKISGNQLEAAGYYPAAQLKKTITVNEDDETVLLYEDMLGRELMRKIERAAGDIITYFVYNNRGSLLYRITPNVISGFTGLPPFTIDQNTLLTQCYSYRYDAQEKLIEEKWPDQEAIYYVYDQWDRLVLSQSGNQRQNNQWTFTKYDRFDRPVLTGLLDNADFTRSAMQSAIDNYYATGGRRYEAYEGVNGAVHGYTNDSYPVLADEQAYLSVTYYDSYDFIQSDTLFGAAYAYDSSMLGCQDSPQGEYCFPAAPLKILRGKVTGSKTKVLNQDQWLPGVVYYDDDGRTIQAIAQNHTGGIDPASTLHNFAGWPLMTYSTLNMPGTDNYAIQRKFVYDHAGRLKEGYHELFKNDVGQGEKFLAENVYNELGQLIEKNLHVEQDIPLQSVDYQYNIRGWLQSINNVQFSVDGRNNDINDLFGMEILYQNPLNGVQPGGN